MTLVAEGRPCHCPNRGCWEAYAGGWAIAERAREATHAHPETGRALIERAGSAEAITAATVSEAFQEGDALAARLIEETGRYLAAGLTSVANAFAPRRIVLGGGVIEGHPAFVETAGDLAREHALRPAAERLDVRRAALGGQAGVWGAATLARRRHMAEEEEEETVPSH